MRIRSRLPKREIRDGEGEVSRTDERSTPEVPELLEARLLVQATLEASDARNFALQTLEDASKIGSVSKVERLQRSLVQERSNLPPPLSRTNDELPP